MPDWRPPEIHTLLTVCRKVPETDMSFLHSSISPSAIVQPQKQDHVSPNGERAIRPGTPPLDRWKNEMAVLVLNQGNVRNEAATGRIAKLVANLRDHMARRSVFRQTLRELDGLSDRDLSDLGLSRANIRSVAYEAAWGTN